MRDWIRRIATWLAVTVFPLLILVPFAHVNIEYLAREHHWDNILTRLLAELPDFSWLLDSSFFWFFFGTSIGTAAALWVVKVVPDRRPLYPPKLEPLILEFHEATEGCRLSLSFSDPNEQVILFRAVIKNPNNQDVGTRAYVVGITKRDMAGNFVPCGFADNLLLTFAVETDPLVGPSSFSVIHNHVPKFLQILLVGERSGVKMATSGLFWPDASAQVFEQPGVYRINVMLVTHTGDAEMSEFILQWSGKWDDTHLSLGK